MLPEAAVPGITEVLTTFHDSILDLQRRFLRIIAVGARRPRAAASTRCSATGRTLTRAIRYPADGRVPGGPHVWAGEHGDINLITALPRATAAGLQVRTVDGWVDAVAPEGRSSSTPG